MAGSGGNSSSSGSHQLTTIVPRLKAPFVKKLGSTHLLELEEQYQVSNHKFNSVRIHKNKLDKFFLIFLNFRVTFWNLPMPGKL